MEWKSSKANKVDKATEMRQKHPVELENDCGYLRVDKRYLRKLCINDFWELLEWISFCISKK